MPPLAVAPDSRVYFVSANANNYQGVGRLSPEGSIESAAFVDIKVGLTPVQLKLDGAGTVYYLATSRGQNQDYSIMRRVVNGSIDVDFGQDFGQPGYVLLAPPPKPIAGTWAGAIDFTLHKGQLYVLLRFNSNTPGSYAFGVARVTSSGQLDPTFGTSGVAAVTTTSTLTDVRQLRVDAAGKIYIGANGQAYAPRVFRLTSAGALDQTFGTGGVADPNLWPSGPGGVELDSAGRVYVPGSMDSDAVVVRLDAAGAVDTTFGVMGYAKAGFTQPSAGTGIVLLPGGGIVLAADFGGLGESDVGLAQFDANGALVSSFGNGGRVRFDRPGEQRPLFNAIRHDPAGRVLIVSEVVDKPGTKAERWIDRIWL